MNQINFYPVVHLLTGPPGLERNGGIWKIIKKYINRVQNPTFLMVQALHFTTYQLGEKAWDGWFYSYNCNPQIKKELKRLYGEELQLFIDSGGFQLLYNDTIDLSKWDINADAEGILDLQLKFNPTSIASLDYPINNGLSENLAKDRMLKSIDNCIALLELLKNKKQKSFPFLVVHGRNPEEISYYMKKLNSELVKNKLNKESFGIALGSQVPLSSNPNIIINNVKNLNRLITKFKMENVPIHIFGIGDSLAGEIIRNADNNFKLSYDNSTYVQNALRSKMYSPHLKKYSNFDHSLISKCPCYACEILRQIEREKLLHKLTQAPAYSRIIRKDGSQLIKSDFLGLIALHNLFWTDDRQKLIPQKIDKKNDIKIPSKKSKQIKNVYHFPLTGFTPRSKNVLFLQCSKKKPYSSSKSHKIIINELRKNNLFFNKHFDIITLSGLYGPVHWNDEEKEEILNYDYKLSNITSVDHIEKIRFVTSQVLNVIKRKYVKSYGLLPNKHYEKAFSKTLKNFGVEVFRDNNELVNKMIKDCRI